MRHEGLEVQGIPFLAAIRMRTTSTGQDCVEELDLNERTSHKDKEPRLRLTTLRRFANFDDKVMLLSIQSTQHNFI